MKKLQCITTLLLLVLVLPACSSSKEISIKSGWARPGIAGNTTAAYFVMSNPLNDADKLLSAQSNVANATEIHLSSMVDGIMSMQEQDYVEIPANSEVEFKPQGYHIMFIGLKKDLVVGDQIELKLNFEKAGAITITVPVQEPQ